MRLALIPPISRIGDIERTDYQLMLPYIDGLPTNRNMQYLRAYKEAVARGDYVILDNGAAEGEEMPEWEHLLKLAHEVGTSEVVLPDVIGEPEATYELAKEAWANSDPSLKYMYVIHGPSLPHCYDAIDDAFRLGKGQFTIGLPRHLVTTIHFAARVDLVRYLNGHFRFPDATWQVHLLGTNRYWMQEVKYISDVDEHRIVRGVDTSAPYCYAYRQQHMCDGIVERPEEYWTISADAWGNAVPFEAHADYNVKCIAKWAGTKLSS